MAIFYMRTSIVRKSSGRSSVASSAYQSGEKLYSENLAKSFFYFGKEEIMATGVCIPSYADEKFKDREYLWNYVEKTHKNRLARALVVAMPMELSDAENIEIAKEFVQSLVERGVVADWSYHAGSSNNKNNKHLHVLTSCRKVDPKNPSQFLSMEKKEYVLDGNGNKIPEIDPATGEQKVRIRKKNGKEYKEKIWQRRTVQVNEFNRREFLQEIKKDFCDICNRYLEPNNQIDHRSYKERNLNRVPLVHEGPEARAALARTGKKYDVIKENEIIRAINIELERIEKLIADAKMLLVELRDRFKKWGDNIEKRRSRKRDNAFTRDGRDTSGISEFTERDSAETGRLIQRVKDDADMLKAKTEKIKKKRRRR